MQRRQLKVSNEKGVIVCALLRGSGSNDGKVYRVTTPFDGDRKHFIQAIDAFAVTLVGEMPAKRAALMLLKNDARIWRMPLDHVKAAFGPEDYDTLSG